MKNLLYLLVAIVIATGVASCSKEEEGHQKWEYKTLVSSGIDLGIYYTRSIYIPDAKLDSLGKEGWELVDVYTNIETLHPNFGDEKYVYGIKPNTRTGSVHYVFKRPMNENDTAGYQRVEFVHPRNSDGH